MRLMYWAFQCHVSCFEYLSGAALWTRASLDLGVFSLLGLVKTSNSLLQPQA